MLGGHIPVLHLVQRSSSLSRPPVRCAPLHLAVTRRFCEGTTPNTPGTTGASANCPSSSRVQCTEISPAADHARAGDSMGAVSVSPSDGGASSPAGQSWSSPDSVPEPRLQSPSTVASPRVSASTCRVSASSSPSASAPCAGTAWNRVLAPSKVPMLPSSMEASS